VLLRAPCIVLPCRSQNHAQLIRRLPIVLQVVLQMLAHSLGDGLKLLISIQVLRILNQPIEEEHALQNVGKVSRSVILIAQ
jgi:hypothetical protein